MGITVDTDKDDFRVKGNDGTHGGKLVGMVDDCLKVYNCSDDDDERKGGENTDPTVDSFGRKRFSQAFTLFQSAHTYGKEPIIWDEDISGSATSTYVANESLIRMQVGSSPDKVIRQTKRNIQYYKGKSQLINTTFRMRNYPSGVKAEIGFGDELDGLFFGSNGGTYYVNRRTSTSGSAVDNIVNQSSWNLDTLDGSGNANNPSGKTLDVSKTQLLYIDFSWLGVNAVRWGFVIDGNLFYVHEATFSNTGSTPYMRQAILPLRAQIESTGLQASQYQLDVICQHVATEGPIVTIGRNRVNTSRTSTTGVAATPEIIGGIRLKSTNKRLSISLSSISVLRTNNDDTVYWRLLYNPDLSAESPTWADADDGITQRLTNNFTQSGGYDAEYVVQEGYILPNNGEDSSDSAGSFAVLPSDVFLGKKIDGTVDELCLECRRITGGGTQQILYVLNYREYF